MYVPVYRAFHSIEFDFFLVESGRIVRLKANVKEA